MITTLLKAISALPTCEIYPPTQLPMLHQGHILPDDLLEFYQLCGGLVLYTESAFPITIVPPQDVVPANTVLFAGLDVQDITTTYSHPSWSWYILCDCCDSNYLTIDLSKGRLGYCYDSRWEIHSWE